MRQGQTHPRLRFGFHAIIFVVIAAFSSCNEDMPVVRDPCDFIITTEESSLDTSTSICQECFFKFSFRGKLYDFRDERFESWYQCLEDNKCTEVNKNDFFEFRLKSLLRSSDLFSSLNEQRALLTPDSLIQTDFNFFQASFLLKDRCAEEYQVVKNTNIFSPDISSSTLTGISIWNYFVIDDTRYSTTYLISGTFSTQVMINTKSESIGGSYALLFNITEPF